MAIDSNIKVVGYYMGIKKVEQRDLANIVVLRDKNDFFYILKHLYDGLRENKPVKTWNELPKCIL